jgi:5-methylcytosine-specific restriction enzyme A
MATPRTQPRGCLPGRRAPVGLERANGLRCACARNRADAREARSRARRRASRPSRRDRAPARPDARRDGGRTSPRHQEPQRPSRWAEAVRERLRPARCQRENGLRELQEARAARAGQASACASRRAGGSGTRRTRPPSSGARLGRAGQRLRNSIMSRSTPHLCPEPGCPEVLLDGPGRCHRHRGSASSGTRGYGASWRRDRNRYIAAHPLCERCQAPAVDVHHRDGRHPSEPEANAWSNLESLCRSCHRRATNLARSRPTPRRRVARSPR